MWSVFLHWRLVWGLRFTVLADLTLPWNALHVSFPRGSNVTASLLSLPSGMSAATASFIMPWKTNMDCADQPFYQDPTFSTARRPHCRLSVPCIHPGSSSVSGHDSNSSPKRSRERALDPKINILILTLPFIMPELPQLQISGEGTNIINGFVPSNPLKSPMK